MLDGCYRGGSIDRPGASSNEVTNIETAGQKFATRHWSQPCKTARAETPSRKPCGPNRMIRPIGLLRHPKSHGNRIRRPNTFLVWRRRGASRQPIQVWIRRKDTLPAREMVAGDSVVPTACWRFTIRPGSSSGQRLRSYRQGRSPSRRVVRCCTVESAMNSRGIRALDRANDGGKQATRDRNPQLDSALHQTAIGRLLQRGSRVAL